MEWAATAQTGRDLGAVLDAALEEVAPHLSEGRADLVFLFIGTDHTRGAELALARVRDALGSAVVIGCGAGGVIGKGREYEQAPAISLLAGRLPGALVQGFCLPESDLPDSDAPPKAWHAAVGLAPVDRPDFVLLADPFTMPTERALAGFDFAYPYAVKIGGLASGARRAGEQVLLLDDRLVHSGAVGVALMGDVKLIPAVAQGCRAIGRPMRVTDCEGQLLRSLDGRPVVEVLRETLEAASEQDRALARVSLQLGFEVDPFEPADERPWLVRNLLGIDPASQGLYVGEPLRQGRRVRFHVRDRATSAKDLERTLAHASAGPAKGVEAALLFSCLGRGRQLYGTPGHDSRAFSTCFGGVPLGGFFCSGEIGPVGRSTHLHGYTSAFGLIRRRGGGAGTDTDADGTEA